MSTTVPDDLRTAWRGPRRGFASASARRTFRLAQAGDVRRAGDGLNDYFRSVTQSDWQALRRRARRAPADDALVRDLLRRRITVAHGMRFEFGDRIDFACPDQGADAVLWLQAWGWMSPLVDHYARARDPEAARFFLDSIRDFYESLPRIPRAKHYAYNSLGFDRALPILRDAWIALLHTGHPVEEFTPLLIRYVLAAGRQVHASVRRFILHNIHTAGCWALFKAARWFPELKEARAWERLALGHLVLHADRSFYPDGCHIERCWGYGSHTLRRLTDAYRFGRATGGLGAADRRFRQLLFRPYAWFARTTGPGERHLGYGDDSPHSSAEVLDAGRKLFPGLGRSLGQDLGHSFLSRPSGFAFFRNGSGARSVRADLSFGEFAGWHSHFDCLNLNVSRGAQPVLEELTRFGSYGHPLDHLFRSAEAHNQMLVDGHPYDSRYQMACEDVAWESNAVLDYFSATHRAYRPVPPPPALAHRTYVASQDLIVRRTVVFVKSPGYLVVLDAVRTPDPAAPFVRAVSGCWHAPRPFRLLGGKAAVARDRRGGCLLAWARPETIRRIEPGWDFDASVECAGSRRGYRLRARAWGSQTDTGINGLITLIVPFEGALPDARVTTIPADGSVPYRLESLEVRLGRTIDRLMLNPERLLVHTASGAPMRPRLIFVRGRRRPIRL